MNQHYPLVSERAGHRCEYCHAPEVIFNFPFEVEHIVPIVQNGADDVTNLALACRCCNLWKADHLTGVDEPSHGAVRHLRSKTTSVGRTLLVGRGHGDYSRIDGHR